MKLLAKLASLFGCKKSIDNLTAMPNRENVSVVIVGMEYSRTFGSCPGAGKDARNMEKILRNYSNDVTMFIDAEATRARVANALKKAVEADLCIFCYSGHGGSEKFADTGSEEVDNKDEFLCLYDNYLRDNDIWKILKTAKGRVVMYFDCCHSSDMFRTQNPFAMGFGAVGTSTERGPKGQTLFVKDDNVNALAWAGCHESTVSWGSSAGGQLTNTLVKYFNQGLTYDELWEKIANDSSLLRAEIPYRIIIGKPFGDKKVFC